MIVIAGIYAFFLTERITIISQNHSSMLKLKRHEVSTLLLIEENECIYR